MAFLEELFGALKYVFEKATQLARKPEGKP